MRPSILSLVVKIFSVKAMLYLVRCFFKSSIDCKGKKKAIYFYLLLSFLPTPLYLHSSCLYLVAFTFPPFLYFFLPSPTLTYHCKQVLILCDNGNFFPTKFSYDSQETLRCKFFICQQLKIVSTCRMGASGQCIHTQLQH